MAIRLATLADLDRVKACARAAYAVYVPRMGREPAPMVADFGSQIEAGRVYVLDLGGDVAGYVVLYERQGHLHVENVAVFPARQGQGLGRALLAFAEEEAGRRDLPAIELYTNLKMTENLDMYEWLGYVEIGRREEDGFSRVYFRKQIELS